MNGPEHYRKAEDCLALSYTQRDPNALNRALIHAVLALASATALGGDLPGYDLAEWNEAAGVPTPKRGHR